MAGKIIIVSGPSGVGKGTVLREVLKTTTNIEYSISATTRPIRPSEVDGVNYFFVSKEEFEEMIKNDELLEYATYAENYYGTPEKPVNQALKDGKNIILEIEVRGAMQVMKRRPDAVSVFIAPPSYQELKHRLNGRGDTAPESAEKRLKIAMQECRYAAQYQYIIINDTVQNAAAELKAILVAESCKANSRQIDLKEEI